MTRSPMHDEASLLSLPVLFLVSLPLLSILGTQLVNFYQNNVLLLILILLIASVPAMIAFDRFIPERLYPLAVIMIALALLLQFSLISPYINGADIHQEYYFANLVKIGSSWNSTIPNDYNAMLSIVMLAPISSIITGMSLTWVFKIIYPLLFSFVPLILYRVYKKQTSSKIAFLSVFFFMSVITFFTEMLALARQMIAELFLGLIILLVIDKNMNTTERSMLLVVFSASLIVSHYATSYIFMFSLLSSLFVLLLLQRIMGTLKNKAITKTFVFLYVALALSWYLYVSNSATFGTIVSVTSNIVKNISTEFLNPSATQGLNILVRAPESALHGVFKMLQILMQFFIILSVIGLTWKIVRKESKFDREFASLTLVNFALCIAAIAVPYLSGSLETTRLYHLTLFFLAPFSVLGLVTIFRFLSKVRGHSAKSIVFTEGTALKVLSMILAVFLLFNTGFVYEIAGDHPYSISLSQNWINEHGNAQEKFALYSSINTPEEVFGAEWLSQYRNYTLGVYADYRARNNVLNAYAMISREEGKAIGAWEIKTVVIQSDSYVYLSGVNIFEHIMGGSSQLEATGSFSWFNDTQIVSAVTQEGDLIYSNGGTEIFYTPGLISLVLNGQ